MVAGGTAQLPPYPAPPETGGHIQLREDGVSLEGLQEQRLSVCLCVCERALSISNWREAGTSDGRRMSSSGQSTLVKIKAYCLLYLPCIVSRKTQE